MKTLQLVSRAAHSRPYATASLIALAERIVDDGDKAALRELHDHRTVFRLSNGRNMLLAQFVEALTQTSWASAIAGGYDGVLEGAYDIAVDRYLLLQPDGNGNGRGPWGGLDCRNYYRLFVHQATRWTCFHPDAALPEREAAAARLLQGRVIQDFRFALMEAKRSINPARTRYAWRVNGGVIHVWIPTLLPGTKRREWLEAHVPQPDPSRPAESQRVQSIIDQLLGTSRRCCWNAEQTVFDSATSDQTPLHYITQHDIDVDGLAATIADEKAKNLDLQRPSVRRLGAGRLEELVRRVFEDLIDGCYEEKQIAEEFGLSRATFSRFAGSRWRDGATGGIPDLWRNTAQTLANHSHFVAAAEEAGVWDQVRSVLAGSNPGSTGGPSNA